MNCMIAYPFLHDTVPYGRFFQSLNERQKQCENPLDIRTSFSPKELLARPESKIHGLFLS